MASVKNARKTRSNIQGVSFLLIHPILLKGVMNLEQEINLNDVKKAMKYVLKNCKKEWFEYSNNLDTSSTTQLNKILVGFYQQKVGA